MNRVLEHYKTNVIPELTEQFKYTSVMQVPKIVKIVIIDINMAKRLLIPRYL